MSDADLAFAGPVRQAELIRSGEVTSRQLVELYLDRIARHDGVLNAFRIVLRDQALDEADAADARAKGGGAGPLNGVPIAVKDDMDLRGQVTAKGSIAHGGKVAKVDAKLVRRLREAGAVVLGKTNVPELMTMPFTESPWYGATRNPWDLDRTPGGSSGGSGAAVAAGLVSAATGSDGAGSIRIPAACCGLVGLKPSPGIVPTPGPSWRGLSTFGFLARTAADAALLYDVAKDAGPAYADHVAEDPPALHAAWSVKTPLPVRVRVDSTQRRGVQSMAETLASLGHDVSQRDPAWGMVASNLSPRYLKGIAEDARTMPDRGRLERRTKGMARLGSLIPESLVTRAEAAATTDRDRILALFDEVDVLVLPLFTSMPLRIGAFEGFSGVHALDAALNYVPFPGIFNHTGLPVVAVPTDATQDGFPLAVQIVGPPESEPRLLALAAQLERAIGWPDRRPPGFE